jgi:cyclopropane fatty-acyl-phospholipid synthase-like methyltransferase
MPACEPFLAGVVAYYEERHRRFGDTARGVDWRDEASQRLRFEILLAGLDLSPGSTLLDVGCGYGKLLTYCRERGHDVDYLGIDVSESMVQACRRRHGAAAALVGSTRDIARLGTFDHVVASGTFNVRGEASAAAWGRYLRGAVVHMYLGCRQAVAFNAMTTEVDHRYSHLFYLDPAAVPGLVSRCGTRSFRLDHSYPLRELTVTLLRPRGEP